MLKTAIILVLLCVIGIMGVAIQVLWEKLKRCRQHAESWKTAAEHWEKQANGW